MRILILSATSQETEGIMNYLSVMKIGPGNLYRGFAGTRLIDILITGPGAVVTAQSLSRQIIYSQYDLVLNAGICGSFKEELPVGSLVTIIKETWGDTGAEDKDDFLDIFDLGLVKRDTPPYSGIHLKNPGHPYVSWFSHYPQVHGLTVSKVHGESKSISKCMVKYNPDVESMEGAAVFLICLSYSVNFQCLRSISNFVVPRDRESWKTALAIKNLNEELKKIVFET